MGTIRRRVPIALVCIFAMLLFVVAPAGAFWKPANADNNSNCGEGNIIVEDSCLLQDNSENSFVEQKAKNSFNDNSTWDQDNSCVYTDNSSWYQDNSDNSCWYQDNSNNSINDSYNKGSYNTKNIDKSDNSTTCVYTWVNTEYNNQGNHGVITQYSKGVNVTQNKDIMTNINEEYIYSFNKGSFNISYDNVGNVNIKGSYNIKQENMNNTKCISWENVGNTTCIDNSDNSTNIDIAVDINESFQQNCNSRNWDQDNSCEVNDSYNDNSDNSCTVNDSYNWEQKNIDKSDNSCTVTDSYKSDSQNTDSYKSDSQNDSSVNDSCNSDSQNVYPAKGWTWPWC